MGKKQYGIDETRLQEYARQIKEIADLGIEIAIVIGGGNIFRGLSGASRGFDRVKGDQMGMLATVINSLALSSALESIGQRVRVYTATPMHPIGEHYSPARAIDSLQHGEIAIISGGTGNPFFTTDTASALRGIEVGAEVMLKGTRVDGIYTADPEKDPTATKFDKHALQGKSPAHHCFRYGHGRKSQKGDDRRKHRHPCILMGRQVLSIR